jgi:hypothetical protein
MATRTREDRGGSGTTYSILVGAVGTTYSILVGAVVIFFFVAS